MLGPSQNLHTLELAVIQSQEKTERLAGNRLSNIGFIDARRILRLPVRLVTLVHYTLY